MEFNGESVSRPNRKRLFVDQVLSSGVRNSLFYPGPTRYGGFSSFSLAPTSIHGDSLNRSQLNETVSICSSSTTVYPSSLASTSNVVIKKSKQCEQQKSATARRILDELESLSAPVKRNIFEIGENNNIYGNGTKNCSRSYTPYLDAFHRYRRRRYRPNIPSINNEPVQNTPLVSILAKSSRIGEERTTDEIPSKRAAYRDIRFDLVVNNNTYEHNFDSSQFDFTRPISSEIITNSSRRSSLTSASSSSGAFDFRKPCPWTAAGSVQRSASSWRCTTCLRHNNFSQKICQSCNEPRDFVSKQKSKQDSGVNLSTVATTQSNSQTGITTTASVPVYTNNNTTNLSLTQSETTLAVPKLSEISVASSVLKPIETNTTSSSSVKQQQPIGSNLTSNLLKSFEFNSSGENQSTSDAVIKPFEFKIASAPTTAKATSAAPSVLVKPFEFNLTTSSSSIAKPNENPLKTPTEFVVPASVKPIDNSSATLASSSQFNGFTKVSEPQNKSNFNFFSSTPSSGNNKAGVVNSVFSTTTATSNNAPASSLTLKTTQESFTTPAFQFSAGNPNVKSSESSSFNANPSAFQFSSAPTIAKKATDPPKQPASIFNFNGTSSSSQNGTLPVTAAKEVENGDAKSSLFSFGNSKSQSSSSGVFQFGSSAMPQSQNNGPNNINSAAGGGFSFTPNNPITFNFSNSTKSSDSISSKPSAPFPFGSNFSIPSQSTALNNNNSGSSFFTNPLPATNMFQSGPTAPALTTGDSLFPSLNSTFTPNPSFGLMNSSSSPNLGNLPLTSSFGLPSQASAPNMFENNSANNGGRLIKKATRRRR